MKRLAGGVLVLAALAQALPVAKGAENSGKTTEFQVDGIRVEIDKGLRGGWVFSDFQMTKSPVDGTIRGVAVRNSGLPSLERWYGYDKDGVIIAQGPLGYQDYPKGEKTRFEMLLGDQWRQIKRVRIAGPTPPQSFPRLTPRPTSASPY